jgi:hypothetical protein
MVAACSRTQSTHWIPTAAARWQSGQVGRSHRWQRTELTRLGWRGQTGSAVGGADGAPVSMPSTAEYSDSLVFAGIRWCSLVFRW